MGLVNAAQLGRMLNLPRQTVYSILGRLVGAGVVEQSDKRGVAHFFADPNDLLLLLEKRGKDIEQQKTALEQAMPRILESRNITQVPRVQYYEGERGVRRLFESILELYRSGRSKEFRGYGVNFFKQLVGAKYVQEFVEKRHALGISTKLIIGKGPDDFGITGPDNVFGREIKRTDMEPQKAALYLVGNRIYLFSYADEVGVMIENDAIVELLTRVFDAHWKLVREGKNESEA